jgi:hypothetical protein
MFLSTTTATAANNDHNATCTSNGKPGGAGRGKRKVVISRKNNYNNNNNNNNNNNTMFNKSGRKIRHIDMSVMDDLLDETDKDTEIRRAWVAIRNSRDSVNSDDFTAADDNSVDYLSDAICGFFSNLCSCDCWKGKTRN